MIVFSEFGKRGDPADIINAAGTLRVLARNTEIHVLQIAEKIPGAENALAIDRIQIDNALKALEQHGNFFGASGVGFGADVSSLLTHLSKVWSDHLAVVGTMAARFESRNVTKAELRRLYTSGDYVVSSTNALIEYLPTKFDGMQNGARRWFSLLALVDFLFLIAIFKMVRAQMVLSFVGASGKRGSSQRGGWQINEGRSCLTCSTSKALQMSEERFRNLTELSSDWIWEQDENFRYTLCTNRNYDRESNELIGQTRWELPSLLMNDVDWDAHKALLEANQPFDLEFQFRDKGGIVRWYKSIGMPIFDSQGVFKGYRGIGKDITERKLTERQIEFLAYRDPLTGLPNRLLIRDRFEQAMAHADRTRTRVALLFLDLDSFKTINDSLGHAVGDALLREIAIRLGGCVRSTDTLSRQGGDEFLILMSDLRHADDISPVLVKIRAQMQELCDIEGNELTTSASIGVALYPDDGRDFDSLLKKADMAMYRAKELGRNTYCFFDEQMNIKAIEHLSMRNGLRQALARSEFVLHYQPQINLASGAVVGAEALIRWQHPELGMISPARFIPVAEESGLIVPIGEWVVHEACRQAMAWRQAGLPELTVAVNLSAVQFKRSNLEQTVISALDESGLEPFFLELELTESILLHDTESVLATVKQLKALGVKLSIDDFGTGYSSLSYLKRFAVDKLKIDQSFIRDLTTDPDDVAIIHAIIQMAHSLNLVTIAEGVENVSTLDQLRVFHCDEAQGFHFARPMLADEFSCYLSLSTRVVT